jgi:hypothetical protein
VLNFPAGGFGDPCDSGCRFGFSAIAAFATVPRLGFVILGLPMPSISDSISYHQLITVTCQEVMARSADAS